MDRPATAKAKKNKTELPRKSESSSLSLFPLCFSILGSTKSVKITVVLWWGCCGFHQQLEKNPLEDAKGQSFLCSVIIVRVLCIRHNKARRTTWRCWKWLVSPLRHLKYVSFYSPLVESKSLAKRGKDTHQTSISFHKFQQLCFEHQCRGWPVGTACWDHSYICSQSCLSVTQPKLAPKDCIEVAVNQRRHLRCCQQCLP